MSGPLFVHLPTPGDHYTPATGSAPMTVIYGVTREHDARGGRTVVLVSAGTRHDYPAGEVVEVAAPMGLPGRRARMADAAAARLGLPRVATESVYRALCSQVPADADWAFLHNAPAPLRLLARRRRQVGRALWVHNELFRTYGPAEMRRRLGDADRVLCNSAFIADRITTRARSAAGAVRVAYYGVDTDLFRPPADRRDTDTPEILFVGRVVPDKGPDLLLRAAARVQSPTRRFRVRIVGSQGFNAGAPLSDYEQELRRLAAPLGDAVSFTPFTGRAEVPDLYRAADILCVPSNWDEPFGLITLEGMATGLAVVAQDGGIPEAGGDAVAYVDPTDRDGFADTLAGLLDDAAARHALGARARARAETFSWAARYASLLEALER